jgi:hypothetical protein
VAGFGLVTAVTVGVTLAISLVIYQRSATDQQLAYWAERRGAWIASAGSLA